MAAHTQAIIFPSTPLEAEVESLSPLRAIVVDDSPDLLEVFCALLQSECNVEIVGRAGDGCEALELVSTLNPDLVLMDIQMPCMDGITAATLISGHFAETKIVLMSGDDSPKLRAECDACGAHIFIHKPRLGREISQVVGSLRKLDTQYGSARA